MSCDGAVGEVGQGIDPVELAERAKRMASASLLFCLQSASFSLDLGEGARLVGYSFANAASRRRSLIGLPTVGAPISTGPPICSGFS